jgi:fluoride exporter
VPGPRWRRKLYNIGTGFVKSSSRPARREVALNEDRDRAAGKLGQLARNKMLLIMLGGALGCYLRYAVSKWCNEQSWGGVFPWGTMIVNVSGSFILALAAVIFLERMPPEYQGWYLLIGTGFCGGFTTFSTFEWETFKLVRDGSWWYAFANVFGSCIAGFLGILLAVMLVGLIFPRR